MIKALSMLMSPTSIIVFSIVLFIVVLVVMVNVWGKKSKTNSGATSPSQASNTAPLTEEKISLVKSAFYLVFGPPKKKTTPAITVAQPPIQPEQVVDLEEKKAEAGQPKGSQAKRGAAKTKPVDAIKKKVEPAKEPEEPVVGNIPAIVFSKQDGITFTKIEKRTGNPIELDPSMPVHGPHDLVVKVLNKDKSKYVYEHYDPRIDAFDATETPEKAYFAIDSGKRLYRAVYTKRFENWDKMNMLLMGIALVGVIMVILALIDKLTA